MYIVYRCIHVYLEYFVYDFSSFSLPNIFAFGCLIRYASFECV